MMDSGLILANTNRQAKEAPQIPRTKLGIYLFTLISLAAILYGLYQRDNSYLSAEEGWGYLLGIIGGGAMLLLGLYPLRKNLRLMHHWGPMHVWFKLHMMLGIIGPILVLYHCNFSLGSTNSNLALYSMLVVACSGLIGRYFFAKTHYGLYGQKATLKDMRENLKISKGNLGQQISLSPKVTLLIKKYEHLMLRPQNFFIQFFFLPLTFLRSKWLYWRIKHKLKSDLKKQASKNKWDIEMLNNFINEVAINLRDYFSCVKKTSQLAMFAKLFSIWHMLHLPLFFMLITMGIIHVVVVHMY
jgi:hypothetical protein